MVVIEACLRKVIEEVNSCIGVPLNDIMSCFPTSSYMLSLFYVEEVALAFKILPYEYCLFLPCSTLICPFECLSYLVQTFCMN